MEATSPLNTSVVARLYAAWIYMRNEIEPLMASDDPSIHPKLDAIWAVEHAIAAIKPTSLDDVRLKSIVVKKWMEDAATEQIVDDLLNSLSGLPDPAICAVDRARNPEA
jgi:hypothetical protein